MTGAVWDSPVSVRTMRLSTWRRSWRFEYISKANEKSNFLSKVVFSDKEGTNHAHNFRLNQFFYHNDAGDTLPEEAANQIKILLPPLSMFPVRHI